MALSLGQISLRKGNRGLLLGGTGSGKSTLAGGSPEYPFHATLLGDWVQRYPTGKVIVLDTKPRFRAEWEHTGVSAARRYRRWDHGASIPGAVVVAPGDWLAFQRGLRRGPVTVISGTDKDAVGMSQMVARYLETRARASVPSLIYADEVMDFYGVTGIAKKGTDDTLLHVARAGRERGVSLLAASQRAKRIPPQLLELVDRIYLFRLDMEDDVKRLPESGFPKGVAPPQDDHMFEYWTKLDRKNVYGPYTLRMLSATG